MNDSVSCSCTIRWGGLFGIFRNTKDSYKGISLYNLDGPKGAATPERELNPQFFLAHQARLTPDLRTIVIRAQDSPEKYARVTGYADPPALGPAFGQPQGQPGFGQPQGQPGFGGPGAPQQPGFPQASPQGYPQGPPGAGGPEAYPAVTFGSVSRSTLVDPSEVRVGPGTRGRTVWWMAEPSNSPPQWSSALAQSSQISFPNFQGPPTTPRVFDRTALKLNREAEIMGIYPSNPAATGFWFVYNDWNSRGATVAHLDPNTGATQEVIADLTQNPYIAITGCAGGFITGSTFGRSAGGQPPALMNLHEGMFPPLTSSKRSPSQILQGSW
jgi:hypothetical protein